MSLNYKVFEIDTDLRIDLNSIPYSEIPPVRFERTECTQDSIGTPSTSKVWHHHQKRSRTMSYAYLFKYIIIGDTGMYFI